MADTKISSLSEVTDLLSTDEFVLARSGATKKITGLSLASGLSLSTDGWIADESGTWTYASASTFTVTGDLTSRFSKGTRLKFTQTTVKYAVVVASSHAAGTTTVTIAVNNDYTIANAAITDTFYSYQVNPDGYPGWFSYTPTWTSTGTAPAVGNGTIQGAFEVTGQKVIVKVRLTTGNTTTFGTGTYSFSYPITEDTSGSLSNALGTFVAFDNSASQFYGGVWRNQTLQSYGSPLAGVTNTAPVTWDDPDSFIASITYRI